MTASDGPARPRRVTGGPHPAAHQPPAGSGRTAPCSSPDDSATPERLTAGAPEDAPTVSGRPTANRPARLGVHASWLLGRTAARARRLTVAALAASGGRHHHYALLASLAELGASSQADLGRRHGFDRGDLAALVNAFARTGYVDRAPDPADRRRTILTLTPSGQIRLDELDLAVASVQAELLAPLASRERGELIRLLTCLLDEAPTPAGRVG
jgi:DNA-binding MarR family transcriptional regulator